MLRSVRTGSLAAASFAILCGAATASAQVEHDAPVVQQAAATIPAATIPQAAQPIEQAVAAAPGAEPSLEQLASKHAQSKTAGAAHECLATAVYFEARGEPLAGQLAVAEVVLNRSRSGQYPADVCAVVKQPAQFSFVENGQFPEADRASTSWKQAVAMATVAQDKLASKLPAGVLWYHADYVAPSWGKRLTRQAKIGLHIFYS